MVNTEIFLSVLAKGSESHISDDSATVTSEGFVALQITANREVCWKFSNF